MDLLLAASSSVTERTLWYPTIQGILVTVCAVVLFGGSIYLLLATNVGARLGFLVSFAGLTGFMVVLTLLWLTTASPLNTLRGGLPAWEPIGVYDTLDAAPSNVRDVETEGTEVDEVSAADVKAAADEVLIRGGEEGAEPSELALFDDVADYSVTNTWELGGSEPNPLRLEFTHTPRFAVVEFCTNRVVETLPGLPPPEPECDPNAATGYLVLERDLGSLRLPPFIAFVAFTILFGLSLLSLHWYEKDRRAAARQSDSPANA